MKPRQAHILMPAGDCPSCGQRIEDWHVEWLALPDQGPVFRGQAGIDCPLCGASVLIVYNKDVIGIAQAGQPTVRRSRKQAEKWAQTRSISLEDYLQTRSGSQYQDYALEP
jgi:hypothetical protein